MKEKIENQQGELIICTCEHKWYKYHKEVGTNIYECEKCGNDNSEFYKDTTFNKQSNKLKNYTTLNDSRMPIGITIENISNKMYENVPIFNYKNKTNLIYGSHYGYSLEYEDILRLLIAIRFEDKKQIDFVTITARSQNEEYEKKQLTDNSIKLKNTSIDGRSLEMLFKMREIETLKNPSSVIFDLNKNNLSNRCNLIISKLYPYTTIDILIFPTEETKYF